VSEVFVTSAVKDADLLLKAMRAGAKEFLSQPFDEAEVREALLSFKKRMGQQVAAVQPPPAHTGRIINVIGAKGGVGPPPWRSTWP
jgi:pilus assembly protein CpaE